MGQRRISSVEQLCMNDPVCRRAPGGSGWADSIFVKGASTDHFILAFFGRAQRENPELFEGISIYFSDHPAEDPSDGNSTEGSFILTYRSKVIETKSFRFVEEQREKNWLEFKEWLVKTIREKKYETSD